MATCDGCGMEFTQEEISAYLDKVLCRKCYPKVVAPSAIVRTRQHSPYLAFALAMLLPGAGQAYAGAVGLGYAVLVSTIGLLIASLVGALVVAPRFFVVILLVDAAVIPLVALALGGHAVRLSRQVVAGHRPEPASKRPLFVFLGVGALMFGIAVVVVVGCIVYIVTHAQQILG